MDQMTVDYQSRVQVKSPLLETVVNGIDRFATSDLVQLAGLVTLVLFDRHQAEPTRKEG